MRGGWIESRPCHCIRGPEAREPRWRGRSGLGASRRGDREQWGRGLGHYRGDRSLGLGCAGEGWLSGC